MADDLADRISDGHVAVLELVPGEQRFIDLSRFVLRGGASRFAAVVLDDEPIRYVLPVGVPGPKALDYGVLLIQRTRCALVWRTDPMKPSHALIAELGPETTVQHGPAVVRGEMWGRFDLRHAGATPMTFLVPPVDDPALPLMLHRVLVEEPRSRQGHVDAEPLAVEITEGIPMVAPVDAPPPAPAQAQAPTHPDAPTEPLEPVVPDIDRTVPNPVFRAPVAASPAPAPAAPPPAAPAPAAPRAPQDDAALYRPGERRAPVSPAVPAPPRPVTPASVPPSAAQAPVTADGAAGNWEVKRRRRTPAPGFAPATSGPAAGARPKVVPLPASGPAPVRPSPGGAQAAVPTRGVGSASVAPRPQQPLRRGLPEGVSGFLTGLIVTLVLGGILVFAKFMGWLG